MDGVRVEVIIRNRTLKPHERLELGIVLTNSSADPITFPAVPGYMALFNGATSESSSQLASIENRTSDLTVAPGDSIQYSYSQGIELALVPANSNLERVRFTTVHSSEDFPDFWIEQTEEIHIDFSGFGNLAPENGETSEYYASGETLFHYNHYRGGDRCMATILQGTTGDYRIITPRFAVGAARIYNRENVVRGVKAAGFRAFNALFVGNDEIIMTSYGNAKVADPQSFQVLDDGTAPSQYSSTVDGYRCSFARDNKFAYFFDESTSTPHAIRIRGCKDPERLESLGYGYARDDNSVFFQSNKLKNASPTTFRPFNTCYATDGKHVFSHDWIVEDADVASFEILPTSLWPGELERMVNSAWARDRNRFFENGDERSEAEYNEHMGQSL